MTLCDVKWFPNSDKSTENYQLTLPLSLREHVSVFWLIVLVLQSVT